MTTWYANPGARAWVTTQASAGARAFHQSLPGYAPTPLVSLPELAAELGVGRVLVKDESSRLGLPAFKVLGASWACHQVLARRPGATLVTGTDGNHGRAVARMAAHFGVRAIVFVPATMLPRTAALIEGEGAEVVHVDGDYDEAVRAAAALAVAHADHALVQDTAWPGYEQVPAWIVAGYQTLLEEIDDQLDQAPGLVVTPVGVGSLAQAVVTHYRQRGRPHPAMLAVEPDSAAGLLASLHAGEPVAVPTADTVMAGLELRHGLGGGLAGAAPGLRRGGRRDRPGGAGGGGGPRPARRLLRSQRRGHPGRRPRSADPSRAASGARARCGRRGRPAQHRRPLAGDG